MTEYKIVVNDLPTLTEARQLLRALNGVQRVLFRGMYEALWDQRGTPQRTMDWSNPSAWIDERLSGDLRLLARRIWESSSHRVNPRFANPWRRFLVSQDLLQADDTDTYRITERGQRFLAEDPDTVREIDQSEGLLEILAMLARRSRAGLGDLLPEWQEFLRRHSNIKAASTAEMNLRSRLANLVERDLVARSGATYLITGLGTDYLGPGPLEEVQSPIDAVRPSAAPARSTVYQAVQAHNTEQLSLLRARLSSTHPAAFERIISNLLDAMGYRDVQVTRYSGDMGVDVVGTVQVGITAVTEVVQVKRHQGSIQRRTLDRLRGALPYHNALRGTIITLGNFSRGCAEAALYPGAAPITLIDGDQLIELLAQYRIGIRTQIADLHEVDEEAFVTESHERDGDARGQLGDATGQRIYLD